jgi:hypothetical protein
MEWLENHVTDFDIWSTKILLGTEIIRTSLEGAGSGFNNIQCVKVSSSGKKMIIVCRGIGLICPVTSPLFKSTTYGEQIEYDASLAFLCVSSSSYTGSPIAFTITCFCNQLSRIDIWDVLVHSSGKVPYPSKEQNV